MFTAEGKAEIERLLMTEQAELESLVTEHERLADTIAKKQVRIEVLQELSGASAAQAEPAHRPSRRRARGLVRRRKVSQIERARRCLSEAGTSLYVGEILRRIGEEDSEAGRNSLASQLMRYVKDGRVFVRDDTQPPRYFALKRDVPDATDEETTEDARESMPYCARQSLVKGEVM